MRVHPDTGNHGYAIHAVTAVGITVRAADGSSALLGASFIISRERLVSPWQPASLEQLEADHLAVVIALRPEVVLLGTGSRLRFPPPVLLAPLMAAGIGYEVMDNAAACRTYNVLNGEGRRVVAALLL